MSTCVGCPHTQAWPWVCVFFWTGWCKMWEQGSLSRSALVFGVSPEGGLSRRANFANLLNRYFVSDLAPSLWAELSQAPLLPLPRDQYSLLGMAESVTQSRGGQGGRRAPSCLPRVSGDSTGFAEDSGACTEGSACTCKEARLAPAARVEVIWGSWACCGLPSQPFGSPSAIAWSATVLVRFPHPPLQSPCGRMGSSPAQREQALKVLKFCLDICH